MLLLLDSLLQEMYFLSKIGSAEPLVGFLLLTVLVVPILPCWFGPPATTTATPSTTTTTTTCSGASATCPTGYTKDSDGTKCYIRRTGQSGWEDGNTKCKSEGDAQLATIKSSGQNSAVQSVLTTNKAYIGLSDTATEGTFVWVDGSDWSDFGNWISSQPTSSEKQDCVVINVSGGNAGKWQHIGCDKASADNYDFVCEKQPTC